jgi:trans-aconitate methyltransferase
MSKDNSQRNEKFDGLANDYERYRPRYPLELFNTILQPFQGKNNLSIVDVGAGTGIALEWIVDVLGNGHHYHAIDISSDMINQGRRKFPHVTWHQGQAEVLLPQIGSVDLVVSAQSFQWMDRYKLLAAVSQQLRVGGVMAVIQNNRNFDESNFLADYESLLEAMSPGYSRHYRKFDFLQEMIDAFGTDKDDVVLHTHDWTMLIPSDAFIGMSRSSTQAQRAITAHGEEFLAQLSSLIRQYEVNGNLEVLYRSELYMYSN